MFAERWRAASRQPVPPQVWHSTLGSDRPSVLCFYDLSDIQPALIWNYHRQASVIQGRHPIYMRGNRVVLPIIK